jgi:hypothetical protein
MISLGIFLNKFYIIECVDIKAAIVDEVEGKWSEATRRLISYTRPIRLR